MRLSSAVTEVAQWLRHVKFDLTAYRSMMPTAAAGLFHDWLDHAARLATVQHLRHFTPD